MKGIWRSAALGTAVIIGGLGTSQAADLHNGGMKDYGYHAPMAQPAGWYLRLDGAYAAHDAPMMVTDGFDDLVRTGFADTWTIGGGIGRYFTPGLRGDVTVDYRSESDVHGRNMAPGATFPGTHRFGLESTVVLANLYYDFNRGGRFNPYIGAGLGTVHHQTTAGTTQTGGVIGEGSGWHAAGAVMGGFTVALTQRVNLDAGYRFLYLGETKAGGITDGINVVGGPTVEDIHAHEFRFGLRYDIR
jgi:opacity protein-like surface antigen